MTALQLSGILVLELITWETTGKQKQLLITESYKPVVLFPSLPVLTAAPEGRYWLLSLCVTLAAERNTVSKLYSDYVDWRQSQVCLTSIFSSMLSPSKQGTTIINQGAKIKKKFPST